MYRIQINKFVGALALLLWLGPWAAAALAGDGNRVDPEPNLVLGPKLLFIHQDSVTSFSATGEGVRIGTMRGAISGVATTNFQFLPLPPPDFKADDLTLLTDTEGDQILFRVQVSGRFLQHLTGPETDPAGNPNRRKMVEFGGPYTGIYEVIQATGKFQSLIGRKFPCKGVGITPAKNPAIGGVYAEIYEDRFE